ncbi:MAG: DUF4365 domain-containing protein [Deltaproteobacteria bacterium]|nr:DUF4365 domain-containing protein [Deltaproteobacteria bacterium]
MSVTALRAALPETWVMHDFRRDYGIDVQIEIFDTDGNSTGLRVYGQLKATDKNESEDILSLDRNHFEYWAAHSDPVLLLRFFSTTGTFKWCWMHDIEWRMKSSASSVDAAPHLAPWSKEETPKVIEQLARLRNQNLHQRLSSPTTVSVRNASDGIAGSLKLATLIESLLPSISFRVLGELESTCHFDVLFEGKSLRVGFVGLPGFVVSSDEDCDIEHIADLAVLLIFFISCRYNRNSDARVIASQASATLFGAVSEEFQPLLFDGLMYSLGIDQAIPLIMSKVVNVYDPIVWFKIHAAGYRASKLHGQTELWLKQLKNWADAPPYPEMSATAAYNAANSLAQANLWHEALDYYKLAGERDRSYFDKDYYWAELGAAQFETDQAAAAAASYQKAFDINPTPAGQWRLGDALFHCGHYESAYKNIFDALARDENLGSYPRLIMAVCDELISTWGIKEQEIQPIDDSIQNKLMTLKEAASADDLILSLRPYLEICAINPLLSFNSGHVANISNQPRLALYRYLTCALRQRGDTQAWANTIAAAFQINEADLLLLILDSAYFYVGEELVEAVLKALVIPAGLPNETAIEFQRQLIALIRATAKSADNSVTMRIHGNEGTKSIEVAS